MPFSRREFMKWTAAASTFAVVSSSSAEVLARSQQDVALGFRPALMPPQKEVWDHMTWMAKLGPKFTGNKAHTEFVEFLATNLQSIGLDLTRDHYTLPRWEAKRWGLTADSASAHGVKIPVTSCWPYSGQTPPEGVTGELVYRGADPHFDLSGLEGKIVFIDVANSSRPNGEWYQPWGILPPGATLPAEATNAIPVHSIADLTPFKKAGAVGIIMGWTNISDGNAMDQYTPFGRPVQNIPGLYVGRETGAKLKEMAAAGAKATIVLEAEIFPDTPTDTLIATLPGSSGDEVIIVNTHTDGSNALEENGGVALLTLAKYFSKIPKAERKRTMVFVLATGHFAGAYVPSIRGVIDKHPDLIKKTVAALAIEHLGAREWADDAELKNYKPTGQDEWMFAITRLKSTGTVMVDALQGMGSSRVAIVNPVKGGFFGEGSGLASIGVPSVGFIPDPAYLLAAPANGCIEKLSPDLMYAEIRAFAKALHKMDAMSAAELKGEQG